MLLTATLVAVVALMAGCAADEEGEAESGGTEGRVDAASTEEPPEESQAASPGFDDCDEQPNTCNEGSRADGGSMTWVLNTQPGAWFSMSPEGGSVYTLQALHGIYPHTGQWEPGGDEYRFNMDLLSDEPQLVSEDPFTFEFYLREAAVWNDGTPITADDFVVTWRMSTSEGEGHCVGCRPRSTVGADAASSVEGSDDGRTVVVTLKDGEADPEWIGWFSAHGIQGGIVPAHLALEQGFDVDVPEDLGLYFEWLNETMPTFSGGPYVLVEGDLENQIIKEPNPNWYGDEAPTLDTLIMRIIDDEGSWLPALANREIHGGSPPQFSEDIVRQLQERTDVHTRVGPGPAWEHLSFNLDNPWFQDVELRRAIFTAIDTADIAQRTVGGGFPDVEPRTNHIFSATSPHHVDVMTPTGQGSGDIDAALGILETAGYEVDGDTLRRDGDQVGPFRLRSTSTTVRNTTMELVQATLARLGIEATIETTDNLGGMLGEGDYDIAQFGWSGSPFFANNASQYWHSESGSNFGGYSNAEVDELATRSANAASLEEAAEYANQAATIVADEAYVLPIMDSPVYLFVAEEYVNVRENPSSSLRGVYNNHQWGLTAQ